MIAFNTISKSKRYLCWSRFVGIVGFENFCIDASSPPPSRLDIIFDLGMV